MATLLPAVAVCPQCRSDLAPQLLACPGCGWLVNGDRLRALAQTAQAAEARRDLPPALQAWRDTLALLPPQAPQRQLIEQRILTLSRELDAAHPHTAWWQQLRQRWRTLGPLGALLALAGKLKFLLLGLAKMGTVLSMLATMWIYAQFWGWQFALGFVVLIYIHEMGHVATLHRYGIRASAPVFIPGLGAFIRMHQYPSDPRENARAGLAGPVWGAAATLACFAIGRWVHAGIWTALTAAGAVLNLFNLIPVWQLDGARGFHALTRTQRWLVTFAFAAAWVWTRQGLLIVLALAAAVRSMQKDAPAQGDTFSLVEFLALIALLAPLASLRALVG